jgi:hypothetical protein
MALVRGQKYSDIKNCRVDIMRCILLVHPHSDWIWGSFLESVTRQEEARRTAGEASGDSGAVPAA